ARSSLRQLRCFFLYLPLKPRKPPKSNYPIEEIAGEGEEEERAAEEESSDGGRE
ncbi:unnamed protein product, partial [Linum tenue]